MSKKSIIITVFVTVALFMVLFLTRMNNSNAPAAGQGKVIVGISDPSTAIQGVTSIMMTVDKIEVQNATQGWIEISNSSKQYDLLQLKQTEAIALLADVNLQIGTYDQIRLMISKVMVTASGTIAEAKLPSGILKIVGRLVVEEGKTSTAVLDFKADKSLHMTGNGRFIMMPVVNFKTKSDASVTKNTDETLKINGGRDEDDVNIGMDEHGDIKDNFEFDDNAKIEIDDDDNIRVIGDNKEDDQNKIKLNLLPQNNSGIAGAATIESADEKVKVTLKLTEASTGAARPAHIHYGSCSALGDVKYPLASTVDGKSETMINASFASLKVGLPLAINIHKSATEIGVYVACADIKF